MLPDAGMTARYLQDILIDKIGEILKDMLFTRSDGADVAGAQGYKQSLPVFLSDEDDMDTVFPYYIVRMQNGKLTGDDGPWTITVAVVFGIYDSDEETNGHEAILGMIQRVIDYFYTYPLLGNFRAQADGMEWQLQDEDTFPYYFGAVSLKFDAPIPERIDDYS